jgi:SAM-dependent methyltransferase
VDEAIAPDGSPLAVYRRLPPEPALSTVRSALPPGATVLELGSGPGRLTHPLVAAGHAVVAVDESAEMLAFVQGAETVRADVWGLDLGRRFDAVLATAHLFDQPDAGAKLGLLAVCRRHLAPRGVVVVERYPPDWQPGEAAGALGVVGVRLADVRPGPGGSFTAAVTYTLEGRSWTQRFAASVTPDEELERLAAASGLRVARRLDDRGSWVLLTAAR